MAQTLHEAGTYTDTPGDTWDVIQTTSPNTTDGGFRITFNLSNLVAGETFEARFQEKDAAAGTLRTVHHVCFAGVQATPLKEIVIPVVLNDWDFSMRQRAGTGRAVAWSIYKVT